MDERRGRIALPSSARGNLLFNETPLRRQRFALRSRSLERSNPATRGARGILYLIAAAALLFSATLAQAAGPVPAPAINKNNAVQKKNSTVQKSLEAQVTAIEAHAEKALMAQGSGGPHSRTCRSARTLEIRAPCQARPESQGKEQREAGCLQARLPREKTIQTCRRQGKKVGKGQKIPERPPGAR